VRCLPVVVFFSSMVHSDSDTFSFACDALLLRVGGFALKVLRRTILGQVDVVLVGKFELFNLAIESIICKKTIKGTIRPLFRGSVRQKRGGLMSRHGLPVKSL
jgi:hypothetical protein